MALTGAVAAAEEYEEGGEFDTEAEIRLTHKQPLLASWLSNQNHNKFIIEIVYVQINCDIISLA